MRKLRDWKFPFGQPVQDVVQLDRKPKKVFVLGVYSSAVHARWVSIENKTIVKALAVASEPYIFWRGDNADTIIQQLDIPPELGKLSLADSQFNGPSGMALDKLILEPLGLERIDAWLCDLVQHSCANSSQKAAIERAYIPVAKTFGLPQHTVPLLPSPLTNKKRRNEILNELCESKSSILICWATNRLNGFFNILMIAGKSFLILAMKKKPMENFGLHILMVEKFQFFPWLIRDNSQSLGDLRSFGITFIKLG